MEVSNPVLVLFLFVMPGFSATLIHTPDKIIPYLLFASPCAHMHALVPEYVCVGGRCSSESRWHTAVAVVAILRKFRVNWHLRVSGCLFWKARAGTLVLEDVWPSGQLPK